MTYFADIDEQTLSAFVDGQLDAAHRSAVIAAMDRDPALREQVYQLRRAKDLMKIAFDGAMPTRGVPPAGGKGGRRLPLGLAASLTALAVGFGAGMFGYWCVERYDAQAPMASAAHADSDRVVLHIDDADPRHFAAAMHYVERFLADEATRGGSIEVVANAGGLDLMREDLSPYEQRLAELMKRHDNVHFIACANAIRNLEQQGIRPRIIDNVETGETALDHLVERVQAGWTYIKAGSLPET